MVYFKEIFLFFCAISFFCLATGQSIWTSVNTLDFNARNDLHREIIPNHYYLTKFNSTALQRSLRQGKLPIPLPDGSLEVCMVTEITNFHPQLKTKFPTIKSYKIEATGSSKIHGRIDYSPLGLHGILHNQEGEIYLDAFASETPSYIMSYYTKDHQIDPDLQGLFRDHHHIFPEEVANFVNETPINSPFQRNINTPVNISIYEFALACTGEYAQKHGGTKEGALSAINTALNRINYTLETEVAIQLQLIANNDTLIFLDGETDPYTNGNASQMALENNNHLTEVIGNANYDVGHVFGNQCSGVVGVSGGIGTVCGSQRGYGSSCEIAANNHFYIGVVCHELGHQFGARHTWNNCPPVSDDQFSSATAFEPGSGSTIMSYAGACGDQNIKFAEDPYYHNNSIVSIKSFLDNGPAKACAEIVTTENRNPEVKIPITGGFYIPIGTPFKLSCSATDADGDSISYCWEQYDPGVSEAAMSPLGDPEGNAPIFRSLPPGPSPQRIFPSLEKILNQTFDDTEMLPAYSRNLTFRITVRDHKLGGGGIAWEEIRFKTDGNAGPFNMLDFNQSETVTSGDFMELKWDVAGTNKEPVNCQKVNILLSLDGGKNFDIVLAEDTPNDGIAQVTIPPVETNQGRILIEAADNIFFDINDKNITIQAPEIAGFGLDFYPKEKQACLPEKFNIQFASFPLPQFDHSIKLKVTDKPELAEVIFQDSVLQAGDTVSVEINFEAVTSPGAMEITFLASTASGDSTVRTLKIFGISNDFTDQILLTPAAGSSGVNVRPEFTWQNSAQANRYNIEVATTPAFGDNSLVANDLQAGSHAFLDLLSENTLYYWRIRPINECGEGPYSQIETFHTINLECQTRNASDLPQNLSQSSKPTISSVISFPETGTISDVNVLSVSGFHEAFNNLTFQLKSPIDSLVTLVSGECGFSNRQFTFSFDDQAGESFSCQSAFNGQTFMPAQSLEIFNNQEIQGDWTLLVKDSMVGGGGRIENWSLELCGSISPISPILDLDTIFAPFAGRVIITNNNLFAEDEQSIANMLIYTLVEVPSYGQLFYLGDSLGVGSQFTQEDINQGYVSYSNTGNDTINDSFSFTVIDGSGGWIPTTQIPILVDAGIVPIHENRSDQIVVNLFPNPAKDHLTIELGQTTEEVQLRLIDVHGKLVMKRIIPKRQALFQIEVGDFSPGIYFLEFIQNRRHITKKIQIHP